LTNEELVKEYRDGNYFVLDELMLKNRGLVKYFANRYFPLTKNTPLEFDDLEQEGWIGFLDAVNQYQYQYQSQFNDGELVKFATYASLKIKYKILNALNRTMCRRNKHDLSSDQVTICSINAPVPGTDNLTIEDGVTDDRSPIDFMLIEEEIDNEILKKDLLNVIDSVFGKGRGLINNVLIIHYGLIGKAKSFADIAERYGVSGSYVQQIEYNALWKIRKSEPGHALQDKYKCVVINSLEHEVGDKLDALDDLLNGILKQCC
jgi:RNA polymerase sigma factor (sigma-70 family)